MSSINNRGAADLNALRSMHQNLKGAGSDYVNINGQGQSSKLTAGFMSRWRIGKTAKDAGVKEANIATATALKNKIMDAGGNRMSSAFREKLNGKLSEYVDRGKFISGSRAAKLVKQAMDHVRKNEHAVAKTRAKLEQLIDRDAEEMMTKYCDPKVLRAFRESSFNDFGMSRNIDKRIKSLIAGEPTEFSKQDIKKLVTASVLDQITWPISHDERDRFSTAVMHMNSRGDYEGDYGDRFGHEEECREQAIPEFEKLSNKYINDVLEGKVRPSQDGFKALARDLSDKLIQGEFTKMADSCGQYLQSDKGRGEIWKSVIQETGRDDLPMPGKDVMSRLSSELTRSFLDSLAKEDQSRFSFPSYEKMDKFIASWTKEYVNSLKESHDGAEAYLSSRVENAETASQSKWNMIGDHLRQALLEEMKPLTPGQEKLQADVTYSMVNFLESLSLVNGYKTDDASRFKLLTDEVCKKATNSMFKATDDSVGLLDKLAMVRTGLRAAMLNPELNKAAFGAFPKTADLASAVKARLTELGAIGKHAKEDEGRIMENVGILLDSIAVLRTRENQRA